MQTAVATVVASAVATRKLLSVVVTRKLSAVAVTRKLSYVVVMGKLSAVKMMMMTQHRYQLLMRHLEKNHKHR